MSVDTALRGLSVSLRPEGADVATQPVSPTRRPLRASSSAWGQTHGAHAAPCPAQSWTGLLATPVAPRPIPKQGGAAGRAWGPTVHTRGSTQGPSPADTLAAGRGRAESPWSFPPCRHPSLLHSGLCGFFWRRGGRVGGKWPWGLPCPGLGQACRGTGSPLQAPHLSLRQLPDLILS